MKSQRPSNQNEKKQNEICPPEVWTAIFSHLTTKDRMTAGLACSQFYAVANQTLFWKQDCVKAGITIPNDQSDMNFKRELKKASIIVAEASYYAIGEPIACVTKGFFSESKPIDKFSYKAIERSFPKNGIVMIFANKEDAAAYVRERAHLSGKQVLSESPIFVISFKADIVEKAQTTTVGTRIEDLSETGSQEERHQEFCATRSVGYFELDPRNLPPHIIHSVSIRGQEFESEGNKNCLVM